MDETIANPPSLVNAHPIAQEEIAGDEAYQDDA
jgi:hypothetical protein